MKIGYMQSLATTEFRSAEQRRKTPFATHSMVNILQLWPDELAACCDFREPNLEILDAMDVWFCPLDIGAIPYLSDIIPEMSSKVIIQLEGGLCDITRWSPEDTAAAIHVMDISDLIVCMDSRAVSLLASMTRAKVIYWPLPYQVRKALDIIENTEDGEQYDIIVPYGPVCYSRHMRNVLASAIAAREICKAYNWYNTVLMFDQSDDARWFLESIGCGHFTVAYRKPPKEYMEILTRSKLVVNMDRRRAAGVMAIECALSKTLAVFTDQCPYAYEIYDERSLCDPFDINRAVQIAGRGWETPEGWRRAYNKALEFALEPKRNALEKALKETEV